MQFEIQKPRTIPFYGGDKKLGEAVKSDAAVLLTCFIDNYLESCKTICKIHVSNGDSGNVYCCSK